MSKLPVITFPLIAGTKVRRNVETGVEIRPAGARSLWVVVTPGRDESRDTEIGCFTLAQAREIATARVIEMRDEMALSYAEALTMNEPLLCDCDGTHAPTPGGHSVACRQRETLDLFGEPTIDEQHEQALAEAAHREALAICASIPIDGRPAAVTELLTAAELLTDEHEHLAAVRHARAVYDELTSTTIVITFERIGRTHTPPQLVVGRDLFAVPDDVAAVVYRHARKFICSKSFEVEVDVERGVVLIEGGRFGRGSFLTAAPTPAPEPERPDYYAQFPQPRADRLAEIFAAFVEHANSGGPGTSKGLIAAAELATTVTERQLAQAIALAGIPKSAGAAYDVSRVLAHLGFDVK